MDRRVSGGEGQRGREPQHASRELAADYKGSRWRGALADERANRGDDRNLPHSKPPPFGPLQEVAKSTKKFQNTSSCGDSSPLPGTR